MAFHSIYNNIRIDPAFINYAAGSTFQYSVVFATQGYETCACLVNIGTVTRHKPVRLRPAVLDYVSELS